MKQFKVLTPDGSVIVDAVSIYHAVELVLIKTNYKFTNPQLLKLN